jgi:MoxR-like ATPase
MSPLETPPETPDWLLVPKAGGREAELTLPEPFFTRNKDPEFYDPGEALKSAVNVALLLGQPLLLTGDPGCGKTSLAYWLAAQIGRDEPLVQVVKSTTTGKDLLYRFDELSRFRDAQGGPAAQRPQQDYMDFEALGQAILFSAGPQGRLTYDADRVRLTPGPPPPKTHEELYHGTFRAQRRQVVLIDELDKAPRDTPNDLLSEIERMEFRIPELGAMVKGDEAHRPVVVITSNSDKSLPEPFLRRCVYHNIPTPDFARRAAIVELRNPKLRSRKPLFDDAMETFEVLRERIGARGRKPGTAELLAWLDVVDRIYPPEVKALRDRTDLLAVSLGTLAKTKDDLTLARQILELGP